MRRGNFILGVILLFTSVMAFSLDDALYKAIEEGNLVRVKQLVNSSNLNSMEITRMWGGKADGTMKIAPIGAAGMFEQFEVIKYLLDEGADPNGGTTYDTVLWWTVFKGARSKGYEPSHKKFREMVETLLKKGAKPNYNISAYNGSPLMQAAGSNDVKMVNLLKQYGGDPSLVLHKEHGNAADYAERGGHIELANELRGTSNDEYKKTLIYAVKNNMLSRVKEILSNISDQKERKDMIDKKEEKSLRTALHYAAQMGYLDIAKVLFENGADINSESLGAFTPLHTAAAYGKTDVAIYLVKEGANINVVQSSGCATGYTSFNWALEHSNEALIKAMLATGRVDVSAGRRHPLEQARNFKLVRMMVEQYKVKPTQAVLDGLNETVKKYDPNYKYYYDEKKKIYNYLKLVGTVLAKENFSSSLAGKDTSFQSFEPININDPAWQKGGKKTSGRKVRRRGR